MSYGELKWLRDEEVKSNAVARSEIARGIGGKTRYLFELATGGVPAADAGLSAPCTPRNPQGQIGCDHSGPPWGCAFRHTAVTGKVFDPSNQADMNSPHAHIVIADGGSTGLLKAAVIRSRQYAAQGGQLAPYQRLQLWVQAKGATGLLTATLHYRRGSNLNAVQTGCVATVSGTSEKHWDFLESALPGGMHLPTSGKEELFVNLYWESAAPSPGSITITGFGFWQAAHLFHQ